MAGGDEISRSEFEGYKAEVQRVIAKLGSEVDRLKEKVRSLEEHTGKSSGPGSTGRSSGS